MKPYPIQLEISGPTAMWARPDTMPNPVSCVAPTFSAVKGIFEAILRWKSVNVRLSACSAQAGPTRCEICAPVQFHRYAFNYGGPLRVSDALHFLPFPPRTTDKFRRLDSLCPTRRSMLHSVMKAES